MAAEQITTFINQYTVIPNSDTSPGTFDDDMNVYTAEEQAIIAQKNAVSAETNEVSDQINASSIQVAADTLEVANNTQIVEGHVNYEGDWIPNFNTIGYPQNHSVSYTDGFNYVSKIDNNLIEPTSKTNTTEWNFIEAVSPTDLDLKADLTYVNSIATGDNILINSLGLVNQRTYISGTATTSTNQYTLDRFKVITLGEALVFSTTNNKTLFTAPLNGVEQIIEGINVQSGTYVIDGLLTATCTIDGVAKINGDTVTLVGGSNVSVKFFDGTFQNPKLYEGTTLRKINNRSYGLELSLCQRYLPYRSKTGANYGTHGIGRAFTTTQLALSLKSFIEAQRKPTSITSAGGFRLVGGNISTLITDMSINSQAITAKDLAIIVTVASGLTVGNFYELQNDNDTTAYIEIETEL